MAVSCGLMKTRGDLMQLLRQLAAVSQKSFRCDGNNVVNFSRNITRFNGDIRVMSSVGLKVKGKQITSFKPLA